MSIDCTYLTKYSLKGNNFKSVRKQMINRWEKVRKNDLCLTQNSNKHANPLFCREFIILETVTSTSESHFSLRRRPPNLYLLAPRVTNNDKIFQYESLDLECAGVSSWVYNCLGGGHDVWTLVSATWPPSSWVHILNLVNLIGAVASGSHDKHCSMPVLVTHKNKILLHIQ